MTDEAAPRYSKLHPAIAAALERDDIPLSRIADLVGLDERTVSRLRLDGVTEERAARYRALDAWIEGRARAVRRDGAWGLEALGQGAPAATLAAIADSMRARADELQAMADVMRQDANRVDGRTTQRDGPNGLFYASDAKPHEPGLPMAADASYAGAMNAQLLHAAVEQVNTRTKGRWKVYNQRLPEDFPERLKRQAAKVKMTPADFLRALIELHTEALE